MVYDKVDHNHGQSAGNSLTARGYIQTVTDYIETDTRQTFSFYTFLNAKIFQELFAPTSNRIAAQYACVFYGYRPTRWIK